MCEFKVWGGEAVSKAVWDSTRGHLKIHGAIFAYHELAAMLVFSGGGPGMLKFL